MSEINAAFKNKNKNYCDYQDNRAYLRALFFLFMVPDIESQLRGLCQVYEFLIKRICGGDPSLGYPYKEFKTHNTYGLKHRE